jgi:hypothetical protein
VTLAEYGLRYSVLLATIRFFIALPKENKLGILERTAILKDLLSLYVTFVTF